MTYRPNSRSQRRTLSADKTELWLRQSPQSLSPGLCCVLRFWEIQVMENRAPQKSIPRTHTHKHKLCQRSDKQASGGRVPLLSTPSACHHPQPENIPFLLAGLVGKGLEMRPLLGVCVFLFISHQWGKLQRLFLFLLAHDTRRVFSGSDKPQIRSCQVFWQPAKCDYATASVISSWAETDYCIHKKLLWRCTHAGLSRSGLGGHYVKKKHNSCTKSNVAGSHVDHMFSIPSRKMTLSEVHRPLCFQETLQKFASKWFNLTL